VWNRQRFIKDPDTGKRVSRPNPESEWVVQDVPELRIVDDALWQRVKERQQALAYTPKDATNPNPMNDRRRPRYLLAGLVKCGCCGGGYTLVSADLLGCATSRNKGTCDNRLNIRRDVLEASVLSGLRTHLMEPALFREFCTEFTADVNRLRMAERASRTAWEAELPRIDRELAKLLQALKDGGPAGTIVAEMRRLEARQTELAGLLANAGDPPPLLHPNMAEIWRRRIAGLREALQDEGAKAEAFELLRSLIDRVTLIPEGDQLAIELRGDLAAMLSFSANKKRPPAERGDLEAQLSLVAGGGFEPPTFRL
jgi:hypothetical protein